MNNANINFLAIMLVYIFVTLFVWWAVDRFGNHQYHYYVEYRETILSKTSYTIISMEKSASGPIYLNHSDFSKGQEHIMDLIKQKVLTSCGNCTMETKSFQIKSLTRLY